MLAFFVSNKDGKGELHNANVSLVESFLKADMHFDDQQLATYQTLRKAHFDSAAPIFENIRIAKNNFYQNIYSNDLQDSLVTESAMGIGEKQIALDKHMLQYFKNIRKICTPAQLAKFDSSFKNVVEKITARRSKKDTANNH